MEKYAEFVITFAPNKQLKLTRVSSSGDDSDSDMESECSDLHSDDNSLSDDSSEVSCFVFKLNRQVSRAQKAFDSIGFDCNLEDDLLELDDDGSSEQDLDHLDVHEDRRPSLFDDEACLRWIFRYLTLKERCKCERVSKTWQSAAKSVNSLRQMSLGLFGGHTDKIQNFCPNQLHRVKESDCIEINYWFDLQSVLIKVPNLKSLHVRCEGSSIFKRKGDVEALGRLCPQLEHLSFVDDLAGIDIYDEVSKLFSTCLNIRHLQLRFPYKASSLIDQLTLESIIVQRALYAYNRNLEILSINVPLNNENCAILSEYCKLRKLSLHGTTIPLQGLVTLLNEGNVRGKYLRCLSIVVDSTEQLAMICQNMICLQSFHCVVNNAKKMNLKSIALIGQLKNLKNLFLSCWTDDVIDDGLIGVIMGCSQLTSLTINADVSDSAIKYLGNFCPFIERLEINNSQANLISDQSLISSIINLEYLRFFTLYYCDVTDDGISTLLEYAKDLEYLSITYSARLTEKVLIAISDFANEKPWERVMAVMPRQLSRFRHVVAPVPKNLTLSFMK